jgi:hypothetical protein
MGHSEVHLSEQILYKNGELFAVFVRDIVLLKGLGISGKKGHIVKV